MNSTNIVDRKRFEELVQKISKDPKYENTIFDYDCFNFMISNEKIYLTPVITGGNIFINYFHGPSGVAKGNAEKLMNKLGFNIHFFDEAIEELYDLTEDDIREKFDEYFEDCQDDSTILYEKIKETFDEGNTGFATFEDLVFAVKAFNLEEDETYYMWDGEMVDHGFNIGDNLCREDVEEPEIEEWIEILENIDRYVLKSSNNMFSLPE